MDANIITRMICGSIKKACFVSRSLPRAIVIPECRKSILDSTKRYFTVSSTTKSSKTSATEDDLDKPIKFTTSKAAQVTADQTLGGKPFPNAPWYQPLVVSFSVGIFLLYFLALREENDMDEYMDKPLWEKIPGLEEQQLHVVLNYNLSKGLDTVDIERRLKEIEELKSKTTR